MVSFGLNSVDLRNNLFVNNSVSTATTPTGPQAVLVSSASLSLATTNNNLYYAGTPGANRYIYYVSGTTNDQTLAAYKTRVAALTPTATPARESNSVTENPPFISTTGSAANYPSLDPAKSTQAADGGTPVSVTVDYLNNTRSTTKPDIGAYEGPFVPYDLGVIALVTPTSPLCPNGS